MGIFPNYNKPGPGVYKDDDMNRGPFYKFFQIYFTKFSQITLTNLMFVIFNIPAMIIAYFGAVYFLPQINPLFEVTNFQTVLAEVGVSSSNTSLSNTDAALQIYFILLLMTVMFSVGMLMVSVGPVQTGLSYLYRNFARRTPTFLWSDFVSSFKKNWKQSTIAAVISFGVTFMLLLNIAFYNTSYTGQYKQVFSAIFTLVFVFFLCIQLYIYPMIASVDLKLRDIYKNAVLLFMGRLVPTLGIFLADAAVLVVIPVIALLAASTFGFMIMILYYLFFAFSFVHYLNTFFVWRQLERYVVKPSDPDVISSADDN